MRDIYLQRAVFSSLQELNKTLHHPWSGNDFINRWVGFCVRYQEWDGDKATVNIGQIKHTAVFTKNLKSGRC